MSKLWIVPTPVGNLGDFTYRGREVLEQSDLILAEDTRQTSKLLKHYGINKRMTSYNQHNEHRISTGLAKRIKGGERMALVTDGGSPLISDPGFSLVRVCIREKIPVECLPGATAFVPALVVSGLPAHSFCFEGFLPHKKGRNKRLQALVNEERSMIFYESPHRLRKALGEMVEIFGADRRASVSRELSKMYEETLRGTLAELAAVFEEKTPKGEFVIVVAGKS